ncbi:MAG: hypothetical protein V3T23_13500 [Nitrososphaerales archaeon]
MELRYGDIKIKVDGQGHIDAQAKGTLTTMEWIAALELMKSQAVDKLISQTSPTVKMLGRSVA